MTENHEIWKSLKDIVEYGDNYEISNSGLVRSIDMIVNSKHGSRRVKGRILKLQTNKDGYKYIDLYKNQNRKKYRISRLVALAFIPNPQNKPLVNHIDGVKDNNNLSNLEWCTEKENIIHAVKNGLMQGVKGENNHHAKLTDKDVLEIYNLYKTDKYSMQELSDKFNIGISSIHNIVNGISWSYLNLEPYKRNL